MTKTIEGTKIRHILYLSNFLPSKGYRDVLEMAKIETERQKKRGKKMFHFDFAGKFFDKEEEAYFHNFVKEKDLNEIVSFHGIVTGNEKRKLLIESDIFVLLSRNEGQPISILEAMGNGMMVVTTNVGGIPDEVTDGENGIVVDVNNIDCNRIMEQLETSLVNLEQIRRNNRTKIINAYTETQYLENMKKVFYMN
ncbi:hypothetical protein GCM10008910_23040 [Faecalicatena orotica]|uniref:glycosyltransferase family 4 protein n=1 Tax=Faecalicatena orotica TaxID=1544 RepID=UPI0031D56CA6